MEIKKITLSKVKNLRVSWLYSSFKHCLELIVKATLKDDFYTNTILHVLNHARHKNKKSKE